MPKGGVKTKTTIVIAPDNTITVTKIVTEFEENEAE